MVWLLVVSLIAGITRRPGAGFFVAAAAAAWVLGRGGGGAKAAGLSGLAALCVVHGVVATGRLERSRDAFETLFASGRAVELRGRVTSYPRTGPYGATFRFRGEARGEDRPVVLDVLVRAVRFDVHPGERACIRARRVDTPRSTASLFAGGGVGMVRVAAGDYRRIGAGVDSPAWRIHRGARVRLSRRLGRRAALPLAILLGERGFISPPLRECFARLGISHLLALSGMHLGLVALFLWAVLRALGIPPRWTGAAAAAILGGCVAVVGDVHSLHRAYVMAVALVAARAVQRPGAGMRPLGCALFVLLAADPAALYSVGFQLSFVATAAVIAAVRLTPRVISLPRRGRAARIVAGAVGTVAAGILVVVVAAPIQIHTFGHASLVSPFATVAFLPAVAMLLAVSAAAAVVDGVPVAGSLAAAAAGHAAGAFEWGVRAAASRVPAPPSLPPPDPAVYAAGVAVLLAAALVEMPRAWRRTAALAGVLAVAASFTKSCGL